MQIVQKIVALGVYEVETSLTLGIWYSCHLEKYFIFQIASYELYEVKQLQLGCEFFHFYKYFLKAKSPLSLSKFNALIT